MSRHSPNLILWDDLRAPASGINPSGTASPPDYDTTNGGLLFDASGVEVIALQFQLPHCWKVGSDLYPHVHWSKTTSASGNVYWRLEYKWASINKVIDAGFTTLDVTTTVGGTPDTNEADKHLISAFSHISGDGRRISDMLMCKLTRLGTDGADTYAADARLLEVDIHYQIDGLGSELEFTKINK